MGKSNQSRIFSKDYFDKFVSLHRPQVSCLYILHTYTERYNDRSRIGSRLFYSFAKSFATIEQQATSKKKQTIDFDAGDFPSPMFVRSRLGRWNATTIWRVREDSRLTQVSHPRYARPIRLRTSVLQEYRPHDYGRGRKDQYGLRNVQFNKLLIQ